MKFRAGIFVFALCTCFVPVGKATVKKEIKQVKVSFKTIVNGQERTGGGESILIASPMFSKSFADNTEVNLIPETPTEYSFIDFNKQKTFQAAKLSNGTEIYTEASFNEYPEIKETGETEKILGYNCKKVKTVLRSNTIEIWYTTEIPVKGTPVMSYGIADGLVLKAVRNGNHEVVASKIEIVKEVTDEPLIPVNLGEKVDLPLYRHLVTESFVTTIEVFNDEKISWGNQIQNPEGIESGKTYRFAGGTIIAKRIKLPALTQEYQVFAELTQYSAGDAYDRTGTVFIIPEDKEKSFFNALQNGIETVPEFKAANGKNYYGTISTPHFSPAVELVRFFTPFGIHHYNDKVQVYGQQWENAAYYKQEITELLPLLQGEAWIGTFIGNYDSGGHQITLRLKYYPVNQEVKEKPKQKWVYPLFNTLNIMEMAGQEYGTMFENDSLEVEFEVPQGVKNLQLRYISTGHGGWGGGDEFNQKTNEIFIDGQLVHSYVPWNCNCGSFRKYNPASGNFWNGLSSSDYSRSGWCPGEATNPVFVPLKNLQPGKHTIKIAVPLGKPEGGSFSAWNISGVISGDY